MAESIPDRLMANTEQVQAAFALHGLVAVIATQADRPFERELVAQTFTHLPLGQLAPEQAAALVEHQFEMQQNAYQSRFPDAMRLIVARPKQQVARVWINADSTELRLVDVIVDAQQRRSGIGSAIILALVHLSEELQLTIGLSVSATNHAARQLYERHGFVEIGIGSGFVEMQRQPDSDGH